MPPGRHPACRWRETQPGSCGERENLAGDAKGKGASGDHREAESTDAPERGGLVQDRETKTPATDAAEAVFYRALERGLSFKVTMGNVLTLTPPLVISEKDLMRGLDILEGCIGEVG